MCKENRVDRIVIFTMLIISVAVISQVMVREVQAADIPEVLIDGMTINSTEIDLDWEIWLRNYKNENETADFIYEIYRDGDLLITTRDTYYADTDLQPDTEYSYYVVAVSYQGERSEENIQNAKSFKTDLSLLQGREFNVDAVNGSDSTGDGSRQSPWATIAYSLDNMNGGDTLIIHSGRYNEEMLAPESGSRDYPTIIRGAEGEEMPVLDAGYNPGTTAVGDHPIFLLEQRRWIRISNLDIRNGKQSNIRIGESFSGEITIEDCHFSGTVVEDCTACIYLWGGWRDVVVRRCYFEGPGIDETDNTYMGVQAFLGNGTLEVSNCEFNGTVKGIYHKHAGSGLYQEKFQNNFIHDCADNGIEVTNDNVLIRNNLVVNNKNTGIKIYQPAGYNKGDNNVIVNNTIFNNRTSITLYNGDGDGAENNLLVNNILSGKGDRSGIYSIWPYYSAATWTYFGNLSNYNLYYNPVSDKVVRCMDDQSFTLAEWQDKTSLDMKSFQAEPVFQGDIQDENPVPEYFKLDAYSKGYRKGLDGKNMGVESFKVGMMDTELQEPHVRIVGPFSGARFKENTDINIIIEAGDLDGRISEVELYDGFTKIKNVIAKPYIYNWTGASAGTHLITAVAVDDQGLKQYSNMVQITVTNGDIANRPPVIYPIKDQIVEFGNSLEFQINALDYDNDILSYSFNGIPAAANFDSTTGTFHWKPGEDDIGEYYLNFTVSDSNSVSDSIVVKITVKEPESKIKITAEPLSPSEIRLKFVELSASTVGEYLIYRNDDYIGSIDNTNGTSEKTYIDDNLSSARKYTYKIKAHDVGGNEVFERYISTETLVDTEGTCYFIDPANGDDDNNDGKSVDAPFKTLRNLFCYRSDRQPDYYVQINPGDVIYLLDGEYSLICRPGDDNGAANETGKPSVMRFQFIRGEDESQTTRFLAYPGHSPVINPNYQGIGIYMDRCDWIEIAGITVKQARSEGIFIDGGNHITIHDIEVYDTSGIDNNNMSGFYGSGPANLEVYDSVFHDNYDREALDSEDGISSQNSTNMVFFKGHGKISVHDCLFYQTPFSDDMKTINSGGGIKYKHSTLDPDSTFEVYRNIFRNCKFFAFQSGSANTYFHHNIIIECNKPTDSKDCGGDTHQTNQIFEYNTIYHSKTYQNGIVSDGGFAYKPTITWRNEDFPDDPSNVVFRNNIVYDYYQYNPEHSIINVNRYLSDELVNESMTSLKLSNNCYYNPADELQFCYAASDNPSYGPLGDLYTFDEWKELTWTDPDTNEVVELNYDQGSIEADPQFIDIDMNIEKYDPTGTAFRPAVGSPAEAMGAYAGIEESPSIIEQPQDKTASKGSDVTLSITATGSPAPTYQWYHGNDPINGAEAASLHLYNVTIDDAGEYKVVVSNIYGSVTSNTVTLTVVETPPPVNNLSCTAEYYSVYLNWENPEDQDNWNGIVVIRKNDSVPTSYNDGIEVYDGINSYFMDKDLKQGQYGYAVYTYKDTNNVRVYSAADSGLAVIPSMFNKKFIKIDGSLNNEGNLIIGQNTRGDMYGLWNTEKISLGRGPGGNETSLWVYNDIIGDGENKIPFESKIITARLVFDVEDSVFNTDEGKIHSINVYQISDPDELGQPYYAEESGIMAGLDFNYRDHRPGMNIPWVNNEGEGVDNIGVGGDISVLQKGSIANLINITEPVDTIVFYPEVFGNGSVDSVSDEIANVDNALVNTLQFDITEAVKAWAGDERVEGNEDGGIQEDERILEDGRILGDGLREGNQGIYITVNKDWENGEELVLSGIKTDNGEQNQIMNGPYIEIIYANSSETGDLTAPETVKDLAITPGESSLELKWINPSDTDLTGIKILRRKGMVPFNEHDGEVVAILTSDTGNLADISETYIDTGLIIGRTYYYAIYVFDAQHNYSEKVWIKGTPGSPESSPTNFNIIVDQGTAALSWDSISGVKSYRIYRQDGQGVKKIITEINDDQQLQYTDYLLKGTYYYQMAAVNDYGEGPLSEKTEVVINQANSADSVPDSPSGLGGSGISGSDITLNWDDNSNNESVFIIEREVKDGEWIEIGRTVFNITEFSCREKLSAGQYSYRVRALNSKGSSTANEAKINIEEPAGVSNISWEVISSSRVKLMWQDSLYQYKSYKAELFEIDGSRNVIGSYIGADNDPVDIQTISGINYCYFVALKPGKEYIVRINYTIGADEFSVESDIIRTSADPKGGLF